VSIEEMGRKIYVLPRGLAQLHKEAALRDDEIGLHSS
jgi:hypothetical protein